MRQHTVRESPASESGEAGFTLIEVLVSIMIVSMFMAVVTAGIVQMTKATLKNQAVTDSSTELTKAFLRFDKALRYAEALDEPSQTGADWYTSYRTALSGPTPTCTQIRLQASTKLLQERTWASTGAAATPTAWRTLARNVTPLGAQPFTLNRTSSSFIRQQLTVSLQSHSADSRTRSQTSLTFTAINSSASSVSNTAGVLACPATEVARS